MKSTLGLIDIKTPLLDEDIAMKMLDPLRLEKSTEAIPGPIEEKQPNKKTSKKSKEKKSIVWGVLM